MSRYPIHTPDGEQLALDKVTKAQLAPYFAQKVFIPATETFPWQAQEEVFLTKSGKCLYLYGSREYGHLFASETEFRKSIYGKLYTNSIILYDSQAQIRCAFELNFDAALPMVSQYSAIETKYPSYEGYLVYSYSNGTVCYIAHYNHPVQRQGYWFVDVKDFEYFFYNVFTC